MFSFVERVYKVKASLNIVKKLLLGPGVQDNLIEIPFAFLHRKVGFQNDNVLRPPNLH